MEDPQPNSDKWFNSYPYKILQEGDNTKIQNYIMQSVKNSKRSTKSFNFYMFLSDLHKTNPITVTKLVDTVQEWGCWKELFVLLIAIQKRSNQELSDYIYSILKLQLEKDYQSLLQIHKIRKNKKGATNVLTPETSKLAKWLPRQGKSFDKRLQFVTNICKIMYPNLEPRSARRTYRQTVSRLNIQLDTTEIKMCANKFADIDFNKIPTKCFQNNLKTFTKHEECRSNLEKFLYKKFISLNMKDLLDKVVFKDPDEMHKALIKEVWYANRIEFIDRIKEITNVTLYNPNLLLVLDLSKAMYDNNNMSIPIGVALLSCHKRSSNKIIINSHNPILLDLSRLNMFDRINKITEEMNYSDTVDVSKILSLDNLPKLTNSILIVTDKQLASTVEQSTQDDIIITKWSLNQQYKSHFTTKSQKTKIRKANMICVLDKISQANELKDSSWYMKNTIMMDTILCLVFFIIVAVLHHYDR